jgi:hypothetical protein
MGIPMAYNTGTTNTYTEKTVKRGTIALNPGPSLAPSYNWFNGVDVTSSQYLIYSDTYTTGQATQSNSRPTAWTTPDLSDTSLLSLINTLPERVGQTPFTYTPVALKWLHQSGRYFLLKNNFENIVTNGLLFNLDASWPNSYSGTTTWFNLTNGNNGTLINGPTFNSANGGGISFDGVDDYVSTGTLPASLQGNPKFSIGGWFKRSGDWSGGATWGIGSPGSNINSYNWNITNSIGIDLYGNTTYNTNQTYSATEWKNIIWTYNGSGFNRSNIIIYINGVAYTGDALQVIRDSGAVPSVSNGPLTLGGVSTTDNQYYGKPIIGSFTAYNRVLSPSEIMQNFYAQGYRFGYSADTIVTSGLTFSLDAANGISYPSSGTTWYDISEIGGNNGTLTNGPTWSSASGGTFSFDGADDYVDLGTKTTFNLGGAGKTFSINLWFNPRLWTSAWQALITKGDTSWRVHRYQSDSPVKLAFGTSGLSVLDTFTSTIFTTNTWYNVVCVYDGTSKKIYVNGSLDSNVNVSGVLANNSQPVYIGENAEASGRDFNGNISNVQIYNRALSQTEITQNYNALKGRFGL